MPIVKRLRRPCIKCEKMFVPTGKAQKVCENCQIKIMVAANKRKWLK